MARDLVVELGKARHKPGAQSLAAALRPLLASRHGIELTSLAGESSGGALRGRAKAWVALEGKELGSLQGVHVLLPVDIRVRLEGTRVVVTVEDTTVGDLAEAASFVAALAARGEIAGEPGKPMPAGATHCVKLDAQGRRLLTRSRFSAVR